MPDDLLLESALLSAQPVEPVWSLVKSPQPLYRLDGGEHRYYYTFDEVTGRPEFDISITSFLKEMLGTPQGLIDWIALHGKEKAFQMANERAEYGKFFHIQAAEYLKHKKFNTDNLYMEVTAYKPQRNISLDRSRWESDAKNDLVCLHEMCTDRAVKVIAVEMPLRSKALRIAGTIDAVVELEWNKKRCRAIIDLKTGRKGFHKDYELQLQIQKDIWEENFPEYPIDLLFNFAPVELPVKGQPYKLQNQTECKSRHRLRGLYLSFKEAQDIAKKPGLMKFISGTITMGEQFTSVEKIEAEEFVLRKFSV